MIFRSLAEYENIVQVNHNVLPKLFPEKTVHELLEGAWSIAKAKAHDLKIIMSIWSSKSSFRHVLFSNPDLMIALCQVNRAKYCSSMQLGKQVINAWKGGPIFDGQVVQCPVVHAHAQAAILLGDKKDGCAIGRLALLNPAFAEQVLDLLLHLAHLHRTESVRVFVRRFMTRL